MLSPQGRHSEFGPWDPGQAENTFLPSEGPSLWSSAWAALGSSYTRFLALGPLRSPTPHTLRARREAPSTAG